MSPDAQNMKTEPDALGIAKNELGSTKQQDGTRRPSTPTKMESGSAKHEDGTRRPWYRRK
jgi:hypothetical protein